MADVTTTPADTNAVVPPPASQQGATTLADVKAARRVKPAKTEPAPGTETGDARPAPKPAEPAAVAKPPEPVKPPETAKIDMDPESLAQFTQLSKEVRETKAKLKETEGKLAEFASVEKARKLAKEGKEYDAIRAAGFDVDKALAELLQQNPGQAASPELLALKREIDDLKAKQTNDEKAKTERQQADADASLKNDRLIAGRHVTASATTYPNLAKAPEFVDGAFKDFTEARTKLEAEAGHSLPGDEQAKLLLDALAVHEEKWAKVIGTPPAATLDASLRAGKPEPAAKLPERMTFAQVKAARRAAQKQ